jgi:Domain of unknown function (DUF6894)
MPLYFFHVDDGNTFLDDEGVEFPDLKTARQEAVRACGEMLRDYVSPKLWDGKPWRLWVTDNPDADGTPLFS